MQDELSKGNYGNMVMAGIGLIPIVGDELDAVRLGVSIGDTINSFIFGG